MTTTTTTTPATKNGLQAQRKPPRRVTRAGGYSYLQWANGWTVQDQGQARNATAAEARYLNVHFGAAALYGGPNHPSYRPT